MLKINEGEQIANVEERLVKRFTEVPADQVSATVAEAHKLFISSTVRDYVALLVERRAHAELQAGLHRRG
ncbi:MAG: three-helix bundle dimerization domain-containing protein [Mycobacterium sp.]